MTPSPQPTRCAWPRRPLDIAYHDTEWCVPVHDDHLLFELLTLEGAQAGLSWSTVLAKRVAYRKAFANFDPAKVARFDSRRAAKLLENPGLVRNRLKIASAISNARAFLAVQNEFGSFDAYLWRFVDGAPLQPRRRASDPPTAGSPLSATLSKDLRERGFRFVGSTICYAFLEAAGLINGHVVECFRHSALSAP
jgi:DNA-3-methyladenine glycosylase I